MPGTSSKSSFRYVVRISVDSRLCANTMTCRLRRRNSPATRRVSARYDRRMPSSRLTTGGLTKTKNFSPRGAPLSRHELEGPLGQALGQLAWIGNRRRRADDLRIGAVVPRDPAQPPQHVAQVAAEHAAIRVQFVDDDEAEVLEQLRPARMVRQDARVQHVGIAEHDMRARANRAPRVGRRVAVVGVHADRRRRRLRQARRPARAAPPSDPAPAPWSGTDTSARAAGSREHAHRAPAGCSRASCLTPSAW